MTPGQKPQHFFWVSIASAVLSSPHISPLVIEHSVVNVVAPIPLDHRSRKCVDVGIAIITVIFIVGWAGLGWATPIAGGKTHDTGLGWAIVIVIVAVIVGWAGLSGTYGRRRDSRYWAELAYLYHYCCRYRSLGWSRLGWAERHLWPE